jgi:amidase
MDVSTLLSTGTARSIGAAIAAGELSSEDATRWYLARIERFNGGKRGINAVRTLSPTAMEQAAAADRELAVGRPRGPLHGVPYLLKDNVFTADGATAAAGARALAGFVPPYEATLVTRLREAGAVLLGKTNLTEFADFVSDVMPSEFSGAGGVVRNPVGTRYDRGQGSSVGSAAAVAARFSAFAIGSETQNSIQTPATFTSLVGFKPTVGRVSRHGVVPLVPSQDSPGPLTVCVADARLIFDAVAGGDARDTATLAWFNDAANETEIRNLRGLRIGVPRRYIADNVLNADLTPAFARVLAAMSKAGAEIIDPCDLPSAEQLNEVRSCVFRTEFKESLNGLLGTMRPSGIASMSDLIAWNSAHAGAIPYGQSLLEAANATNGLRTAQYINDRRRDIALAVDGGIVAALRAASAHVLLAPMSAAAKCTGKAGAPVIAIPAGRDASGAPFGITLFAAPGDDRALLRIAAAVEQLIGERIEPQLAD